MNNATLNEIARAFTEWERRFREQPEKYTITREAFACDAQSYGEVVAPYFISILAEIQSAKPKETILPH